jgi:hypothetical protein
LRRLPSRARRRLGRSFMLFKMLAGVMWSKGYRVTDAEVRELHSALDRHDGLFYLAAAAGFVADHKAQGDRLDFGHLFKAYRDQFPFLVGGSDEDPFEHRQIELAHERLGKLDLQIVGSIDCKLCANNLANAGAAFGKTCCERKPICLNQCLMRPKRWCSLRKSPSIAFWRN